MHAMRSRGFGDDTLYKSTFYITLHYIYITGPDYSFYSFFNTTSYSYTGE